MDPRKFLRLAKEKFDAADKAYDNEHYQQAVDLWMESSLLYDCLKEEELNYAACLENAANALGELGNYNQAKKLFEIVLPIKKEILGSEHPDIAKALNNLATIYQKQGDIKKAAEYFRRAQNMIKKTFDENHPDVKKISQNYLDLLKREEELKIKEKNRRFH